MFVAEGIADDIQFVRKTAVSVKGSLHLFEGSDHASLRFPAPGNDICYTQRFSFFNLYRYRLIS
jgi:hypothetical protein